MTDRTETGELRWLRLGRQSGRRLLRELYSRCAPRSVWDVFHRWQGEVYYTVLRRPLSQDLPRGVYLLSRFEDQTGLDVTGLFWLENVTVGVAHLCKGEFFEELLDLLLLPAHPGGRAACRRPRRRPWSADTATCFRRPLNNTAGAWAEAARKKEESL